MNKLRDITKIQRNINIFKNTLNNQTPLSNNEYETLRLIVKHPGSTNSFFVQRLGLDKGLISRYIQKLIACDYILEKKNPDDLRMRLYYPSQKALELKINNEAEDEVFFSYLESLIPEDKKDSFYEILDTLYLESKRLRHDGFKDLKNEKKSK